MALHGFHYPQQPFGLARLGQLRKHLNAVVACVKERASLSLFIFQQIVHHAQTIDLSMVLNIVVGLPLKALLNKTNYLGGSGELWPCSKPLRDKWGARWSSSYIYAQVSNGSMCWLWGPVGNRVIWWFCVQTCQPNTNCILVFTQAMANVTMRTVSSDVRHSGGHCYLQILVD